MADKNYSNLDDLFKDLQDMIDEVLLDDVAQEVREVMKHHVEVDVYEPYEPVSYKRKKENGGLLDDDNINAELVDSGELKVRNIREDIQKGKRKDVAKIIENGGIYGIYGKDGYKLLYPRKDHEWYYTGWKPRPFTENTRKDLQQNHQHLQALKKGMSKKVEVE